MFFRLKSEALGQIVESKIPRLCCRERLETGQPDAGHNIHARLPRDRTRSCPGNNGVAPGEQDGTR